MRLAVSHRRAVNDYAKPPRRQAEDESADADSESADSIDHVIGTGKVVDTDDEASAGSLCSASSSGDDIFIDKYIIPKPLKPAATGVAATGAAATGAVEAKGASKARRSDFEPLWSDPYSSAWGHPNVDFVRLMMQQIWRQPAPAGMGDTNWSKQLTPRHFAEDIGDPTRSLLLLRAWALWRAGQGGWASLQRGRSRHFKEQEVLLERDIKALGARCKLLGNRKANSLLKGWAPEVVERLLNVV